MTQVEGWNNFDNLTDYQKAGACLTMIASVLLLVVVLLRVNSGYWNSQVMKFDYMKFLGIGKGAEKSGSHTMLYVLLLAMVFTGALSFFKEDDVGK